MNKKYYAVAIGKRTGIFTDWEETRELVVNFSKSKYKSFKTISEAERWLEEHTNNKIKKRTVISNNDIKKPTDNKVIIYTDGSCKKNPGPGGYGVLLLSKDKIKEISEGFRLTTNNRMELLACIVGLENLKKKSEVELYSDSSYVVNSINKGWAKRWKSNGWKQSKTKYAENIDLWEKLLKLIEKHSVNFNWVKGHANNPGNERCDKLASEAAIGKNLKIDSYYENKK